MTSVWFKWRSATRRKQKSCSSLSPSLPPSLSLCLSLSPRPPPTGTTSIQLKYVTITEWQLDTQWPVRTFISQCFILVRSQTAEKISKLFQGLEGDQTFLASPLNRPLIYNGLVRARLDSVCLKTYRGSSTAQPTAMSPTESIPLFPEPASWAEAQNFAPLQKSQATCHRQSAPIKSLLPRWKERERSREWRERGQAELLPPIFLPLSSKSKVIIFPPEKKKRYPEIATTSEFSQPYSNRNAQLKKKKMSWTQSAGV